MSTCKDCLHVENCEIAKMTYGHYADDYDCDLYEESIKMSEDVQEVRHGKWIYVDEVLDYADCKCSECEHAYTFEAYYPGCLYNYCPHCGAKMDKE